MKNLLEDGILKIKFGNWIFWEFFENLLEDGILEIKFGNLEFLENLFEDDILKIKFELLELRKFWKFLRMVVLENYSKNGILKN